MIVWHSFLEVTFRKVIMKKIILTLIVSTLICHISNAQSLAGKDTIWRKGGITALNFNQVSLSNWAAGGNNAISLNALMNLFANYKRQKKLYHSEVSWGMA